MEYKQINQKLGGTRTNRVYQFFGIVPPSRVATVKHKNAKEKKKSKVSFTGSMTPRGGKLTTSHLEREKKRKSGGTAGRGRKCPRLANVLFSASPLRSKGPSEDAADTRQTPSNVAPV